MRAPEQAYAAAMANNDDEKRNQTVLHELPLVYYVAKRIHDRLPKSVAFEDLVQAGVLGLIDAVRSYDPSKNAQLRTFAQIRIRGAIMDSLRQQDWGSRNIRQQARKIDEAIHKLSVTLGRQPSEEEMAAELQIKPEELYSLLAQIDSLEVVSQHANSLFDYSETHDLLQSVATSPDESPFALYCAEEDRARLAQAISGLSEKEQLVLSLYYREELTMKEIGKVMQITQGRVCQIHSVALAKLRSILHVG